MTPHIASPPSSVSPAVVRLSGAQGMVAAVPQCLGFEPTNSLVLLCLTAPRGRVGPVARVDLFPPGCGEPATQLATCAQRYADSTAVVCYHDGDRPGCIDDLVAALAARDVPVSAVLSVSQHRIRDASSPATMVADSGIDLLATDDGQSEQLAAASVFSGRRVLPSRDALAESITPRTGADSKLIDAALLQARDTWISLQQEARSALTPELYRGVDSALAQARLEYARGGAVTSDTAAEIAVLSQHVPCRDQLLARTAGGDDPAVVPLLISVASQCPDDYCAQLCSVLAAAAYRFGDGALAHCAVDRTLSVEPDHRLAHLLLTAICGGLPPQELASLADIPLVTAHSD